MSDATRCGKCSYVYWTTNRENWGTCPNCNTDNDFSKEGASLIDSKYIFTFMNNIPQKKKK